MKKILLLIALTFIAKNSYSKDPIKTTLNAVKETEQGKNVERKLASEGKKILKVLPPEMIALSKLGIEQEVDFKFKKNHNINLNYRNQSVSYQFNLDF